MVLLLTVSFCFFALSTRASESRWNASTAESGPVFDDSYYFYAGASIHAYPRSSYYSDSFAYPLNWSCPGRCSLPYNLYLKANVNGISQTASLLANNTNETSYQWIPTLFSNFTESTPFFFQIQDSLKHYNYTPEFYIRNYTESTSSSSYSYEEESSGITPGEIAGMVVGTVSGLAFFGVVATCLWKRKKHRQQRAQHAEGMSEPLRPKGLARLRKARA